MWRILASRQGVVSAIVLAGSTSVAAQVLATQGAPPGPRTGMVIGQVVDGTTGQPVSEAVVRLTMPRFAPDLPTMPEGRVMADTEGRFFFADLPAGEYWLQAALDGYVSGAFGQRRLDSPGELLTLGEGERRIDVTLRVWKHAVIAGRVLDETNEPVVGVSVRALARDIVAGRVQFGAESYLVPTTTTDDRGMFRLSRVPPGTYAVVVPSTQTTVPISVMNSWDPAAMRTALFWGGVREVSPLGNPRTQQIGEQALMTLATVQIPPAAAGTRLTMYRATYYPSAATASASTPISVTAGEERSDLLFTLRPTPSVRVSGRLVTPEGTAPPHTTLKLVGDARSEVTMASRSNSAAEVGLDTAVTISDASGRFTFLGVPPGDYVLMEADMFLSRAVREGRQPYWVRQRIAVGDGDLQDLVVRLRPALRLEGRITVRGAASPVPPGLVNAGVVFETSSGDPEQAAVQAQDGQFATVAAGGRYIARPSAIGGRGWYVESITSAGKDITERAFDLDADATSIVVTFTDRPSKVAGSVKDARGGPATEATVLVFPTDRERWSDYGKSPRLLRSATVSPAGTYAFDHLVPGQYLIVAIDAAQAEGWRDPKVLQALAGRAEQLTVASGDAARVLDLTVRTAR